MQNLKRITTINIILYAVFIALNLIELIWYSDQLSYYYNKIVVHKKISSTEALMQMEVVFHSVLNLVSYGLMIVQLFFFNHYVKRNNLGKSYHWLLLVLAFIPVIHYFLCYFIWLKLNKLILDSVGKKAKNSERKIILMWVFVLMVSTLSLVYPYWSEYVHVTEGVFALSKLAMIYTIFNIVVLLIVSVIELLYLMEFRNELKNADEELSEEQLLDS